MICSRSIVFWRKIPKLLLQERVIYWAAIFQFVFPLGRILIGKGIFKDKKMSDFILLLCYKMLANKKRCRHFVTDSGKRWRRPKWIKYLKLWEDLVSLDPGTLTHKLSLGNTCYVSPAKGRLNNWDKDLTRCRRRILLRITALPKPARKSPMA